MFLQQFANPRTASPLTASRAHKVLCETSPYHPHTTFLKTRDHRSLLVQAATEAETSFSQVVRSTVGSRNSSNDTSSSIHPPPTNISPNSGAFTSTAPCMLSSPQSIRGEPCNNRLKYQRDEKREVQDETGVMMEETIAISWKAKAETHAHQSLPRAPYPADINNAHVFAPFSRSPSTAHKFPEASMSHYLDPERASGTTADATLVRKPADYYVCRAQERILAQRITPQCRCWDSTPARARSTTASPVPSSAPFIFQPTFDIDAVEDEDESYITALLPLFPIPPNSVFYTSATRVAGHYIGHMEKRAARVEEPVVVAPRPIRPIAIGLMEGFQLAGQ